MNKNIDLRNDIIDAALGHDLIEDTVVTEVEIIAASSERTLSLIKELSNPADDYHIDEYMKKLGGDSEEARIVKYCDLIENTNSICYAMHSLKYAWLKDCYKTNLTAFDKSD